MPALSLSVHQWPPCVGSLGRQQGLSEGQGNTGVFALPQTASNSSAASMVAVTRSPDVFATVLRGSQQYIQRAKI